VLEVEEKGILALLVQFGLDHAQRTFESCHESSLLHTHSSSPHLDEQHSAINRVMLAACVLAPGGLILLCHFCYSIILFPTT
jgi:hypothetical protein